MSGKRCQGDVSSQYFFLYCLSTSVLKWPQLGHCLHSDDPMSTFSLNIHAVRRQLVFWTLYTSVGTTGVPGTETVPNYRLLLLLMRVMHMDNGNTTYLLFLRLLGERAKRPITLACLTTA